MMNAWVKLAMLEKCTYIQQNQPCGKGEGVQRGDNDALSYINV